MGYDWVSSRRQTKARWARVGFGSGESKMKETKVRWARVGFRIEDEGVVGLGFESLRETRKWYWIGLSRTQRCSYSYTTPYTTHIPNRNLP